MNFDISKLPLSITHSLKQAGIDVVRGVSAIGNVEKSIGDSIAVPISKALKPKVQSYSVPMNNSKNLLPDVGGYNRTLAKEDPMTKKNAFRVQPVKGQAMASSSFSAHGKTPWGKPIASGGGTKKVQGIKPLKEFDDLPKYNPISI